MGEAYLSVQALAKPCTAMPRPAFYDEGGATVINEECISAMASMHENSVDTIITDPPYGLGFMGKEWDSPGGVGNFPMRRTNARNTVNTGASRQGGRQRGCVDWAKRQARDMQAFQAWTTEWATAALRVAKPGTIMLAFGGTRTYHRLTCGIEDAGWEIRDCMSWLYGSGFPKSLDISKAIDKAAGAEREVLAEGKPVKRMIPGADQNATGSWIKDNGREFVPTVTAPATEAAQLWNGWGTALKPAWEPIVVAMKPLDGTFATNAQRHGVAGLNIDGGRIDAENRPNIHSKPKAGNFAGVFREGSSADGTTTQGRWPANVLLDEDAAALLDEQSGEAGGQDKRQNLMPGVRPGGFGNVGHDSGTNLPNGRLYGDTGGASRFFYTAKASKSDRGHGNDHPTVKPTDLMKYLCNLTRTPTGGVILDPFAGSGTTLVAAREVGRRCIGIELDAGHCRIIADRLAQGVLFAPAKESA